MAHTSNHYWHYPGYQSTQFPRHPVESYHTGSPGHPALFWSCLRPLGWFASWSWQLVLWQLLLSRPRPLTRHNVSFFLRNVHVVDSTAASWCDRIRSRALHAEEEKVSHDHF